MHDTEHAGDDTTKRANVIVETSAVCRQPPVVLESFLLQVGDESEADGQRAS